ncbi:hypothetical protein BaRGS_00000522 [Batillaria attramentaria]|uniref:Uncharacterized protein n=1 Tax=Batillaria attramentaria TaxID=370345 RepID=A0ABD0M8Z7_9CAEN
MKTIEPPSPASGCQSGVTAISQTQITNKSDQFAYGCATRVHTSQGDLSPALHQCFYLASFYTEDGYLKLFILKCSALMD